MKKPMKNLLLWVCIFTLLLAGCRDRQAPTPPVITGPEPSIPTPPEPKPDLPDLLPYFSSESVSYGYQLTAQDGAAIGTVQTLVPSLSVQQPDENAAPPEGEGGATEQAAQAINQYYEDELGDIDAYAQFDLQEQAQNLYGQDPGSFVPFELDVSFNVTRSDPVLFSVIREYYEYLGGAYPSVSYRCENFLADSGALLTLDDVFAAEQDEYYPLIRALVLEQAEAREADNGLEYVNGYRDTLMDRFDPTDFVLDEEGIRFIWQEGALGPHAIGAQVFLLSYESLSDVMESRWIPAAQ